MTPFTIHGLTPPFTIHGLTPPFTIHGGDSAVCDRTSRTIGEKLNVTTVLEGSVRRAGDRVRITVRLSEVASGFQLWSERYDRDLKDIFDVQDGIAKVIVERLRVTLAAGPKIGWSNRPTRNIEAFTSSI